MTTNLLKSRIRESEMNIKHIVRKYGLTLADLSAYTGVDRTYLWRLMMGERQITVDMEARLKVGLRKLLRDRARQYASAMKSLADDKVPLTDQDQIEIREFIVPTLPDLGGEFVEIGQQTAEPDRKEQPEVEIID